MKVTPLAIERTGLVTAVGLSTPASCAAVRAKISNPTETRFIGSDGEWIMAHQVILDKPWGGLTKLIKMAAMAIGEALHDVPRADWGALPLLLCVAEKERPGRLEGLDDRLFGQIQEELRRALRARFRNGPLRPRWRERGPGSGPPAYCDRARPGALLSPPPIAFSPGRLWTTTRRGIGC